MPRITLLAGGMLGLIFLVLTLRVILHRERSHVSLGEGAGATQGQVSPLFVAVRAHANFAEFVPLTLALIAGLEALGGPRILIAGLNWALVLGRILHPVGMGLADPNWQRAAGVILTLLALAGASIGVIIAVLAAWT